MLSTWRSSFVLLVVGLLVAIVVLIPSASRSPRIVDTADTGAAPLTTASNLLSVPGVEQLDGGEEERDQLVADRATPTAVLARRLSRTRYEHLSTGTAIDAIKNTVPAVVRTLPGGIGTLPVGVHVSRYLSPTSARLDLPDGKHAIVESTTPAATRAASSGYAPVDLALHGTAGGFAADNTAAPVSIPRELADGVKLDSSGVSLTPLDASGAPLRASGQLQGGSVLYPNTATDADTAAKATDTGMEVYGLLRSVDSPQQLSYMVGLPHGASLAQNGPGSVKVVDAGHTLAVIPAPSAEDAAGTVVPVSTRVSGNRLQLRVDHRSGDYLYPIVVDPTVTDIDWPTYEKIAESNWRFEKGEGDTITSSIAGNSWTMKTNYAYIAPSEWGAFLYPTQGESHIYATKMEAKASGKESVEHHLIIAGAGGWEASVAIPRGLSRAEYGVCVAAGCASTGGTASNITAYWMNTIASEVDGGGELTGYAATVYIAQNNGPAIAKDTTKELNSKGERNAFYGTGGWLSSQDKTVALFDASDPGIGVSEVQYTVGSLKWSVKEECPYSVQCPPSVIPSVAATDDGGLPEGEKTIEAKALDDMGLTSSVATATIKVDRAAPHEITLSGLPTGNVINDATQGGVKLIGHATDGVTGTPSSGVASLKLAIDGHEVGSPKGACSPGPCTATGEWTINGEEFAVGEHTAIVTATDAAGNVQTGSTKFSVQHARPVSFGPGELNPVTGEFDLQETDVSLSTIGSPLSVARGYDSREPAAGATGAFGAPWSLSLDGAQQLVRLPNGSVTLISGTGAKSIFTALGGGKFESPTGDASLVLSVNAEGTEYTLQDNGSSTVFKHISGDGETVFRASVASGTSGSESIQYTYESVRGVVEPEEELGPVPAGVSCAPTLNPGCRALTFSYASSTTATGEGASEWGGFTGRLMSVYFKTGEEKEGKVVEVTKTVAQYAYDSKGRLRAEWDPRISPALKTTYGYDPEGHVTVISPPGQESWVLTYGTSSTDIHPGRLIKAMRPPASQALWNGEVLKNTAAPTLSGSAALKVRMAVSDGTWTGAPIVYGYQWLDCNIYGVECQAIGGATNPNYTPVESDIGHALVAQVTATNGGGSVTAKTSPSAVIAVAGTVQTLPTSTLNAIACIPGTSECVVNDNKGNAYVSTNVTPGSSTWSVWFGPGTSPGEALACPTKSLCLMADGERGVGGGLLYYARVVGGSWTQAIDPGSNGTDAISCASESFCVEGQNGSGYFRYSTSPASASWVLEQQGSAAIKAVYCLSTSFCAMGDSTGKVHVATSTAQIESSTWTESNVDSGTALNGVSCTSTTSCVAVDGAGNVLNLTVGSGGEASVVKHDIDGTNVLTAVACSGTSCATVDAHGNVFVSTNSGSTWTMQYELKDDLTSVSCPSSKLCATVDTTGHFLAFDPTGGGTVTEGEARPPQPGTTIEYNVPVSGSGAPHSLSSGEVSKWAQTDLPVEATAIFPADEPVGWPAPDYRRATVDYLDLSDRLVNVANPAGGILTNEYNSHNDLVRALTATNRASALKEGSTSAEVAQTLDTQSTYNSEGTELLSTLGPLHTIKRTNGATAKARLHVLYSYDEGAPETGGPYRLVTKVTEGAQIAGESKDLEVRTTTKSYAGQNDLGWTLREPTATIANPGSEPELIHSTVYEPNTGKVTETRTPGAGHAEEAYVGYEYSSSFGSAGSGNGQLSTPGGVARDSEGNIWVADNFNNRIEEFSSAGTYIRQITAPGCENEGLLRHPSGLAIDKSGIVWALSVSQNCVVGFTSTGTYVRTLKGGSLLKSAEGIAYSNYNNRLYVANTGSGQIIELNPETNTWFELIGKSGTGNGEFSSPEAIAVDASGNLYVGDKGRVQKLSATGAYISQFGSGHLNSPRGIALDSKGNILVTDGLNEDVQGYGPSGAYQYQFGVYGSGSGQMYDPIGIALDSSDDAYVVDSANNRIEKWLPSGGNHKSHGNGGTHGMQTIYYSAGANTEVSKCGNHAEWAGLPCEKRPAAQPETSGLMNLPVTTLTYNLWDEPVESTEIAEGAGSATRTNTDVYDEAGRLVKDTVSSSIGTALPSVEYEYNTETGDATKSKTTVAGVTQTLESAYDKRGELSSYKDADGNTASFHYDPYGRLESLNDGKGTQTYSYDTTTGLPTKLVDSAAGTFTAAYDVEGDLTTVGYPNGMNVNHAYDPTGSETGIEYLKTTHCSTGCVWYSQTESPSIHGQALSLSSTFSSQSYTYDEAGRLTKAQDTPAGEGCTTRVYAYDVETNIRSLTTRPPGTGGVCASSGGTAVNHTYDSANRLTDSGIAYDGFGDVTKLSAGNAGGYELSSAFYADETLASQTQNGQTIGYYLDPSGRDRQIISTGTTNSTVTYHYAGEGNAPAWTEDTAGKWTRNVYGFEGLVATQNGGESAVLQIQDLKGNIVGTASLSETATGLISKGDTTEYGVPRTSSPPKYSWQGAAALRTELPSGVIAMGARSYVPEISRFLQPDPIEGGSANEYSYTYGDPINTADPSGEYTVATPSWVSGFFDEQAEIATEAAIQKAAEEQAALEEAEEKAQEAAEAEVEAAQEAAEAASGAYTGSGKKGKKGKAGKINPSVAMYHDGGGPNSKPKYHGKPKSKIEPNKHCEPGEVQAEKGGYCEKGPEKGQRPDPPIPPPGIIGEIDEGANDVCEVVCPAL
jgi:RHS repeat-associated protein